MTKARIQTSNTTHLWRTRTYAVTRVISGQTEREFLAPITRRSSIENLEEIGPIGRPIVEGVFNTPGVDKVKIRTHEIVVTIGEAYRWFDDGIHEHILDILKYCAFSEKSVPDIISINLKDFEMPVEEQSKGGAQPTS